MKNIVLKVLGVIFMCACLFDCSCNQTENTERDGLSFPVPGSSVQSPDGSTPKADNASTDTDKTENETTVEDKSDENTHESDTTDRQETEQNISDNDWNLILVNPWNSLPEDFEVTLTNLKDGHKVDERAYPDLQAMMDDMRAEGLSPYICSSYRTMEKQQSLYKRQINQYLNKGYSEAEAAIEAGRWVAVPGTSEHQTGLALDIVASYHVVLDESQEDTAEQKWLMQNSWKYGFILRYPNGKTDITGIYYEPWHYRYVGKTAAKEIFESGLTLEEYLGIR